MQMNSHPVRLHRCMEVDGPLGHFLHVTTWRMIKSELREVSCYKFLCLCGSPHCSEFVHSVQDEFMWSLRENWEPQCHAAQVEQHKKKNFTFSTILSLFVHLSSLSICARPSCRFPQEEEQLQHWISSMRTATDGWIPSESARLCSDHFTSDCFQTPGHLHSPAVPSVFQSMVGLHFTLYFKGY